MRVTRTLMPLAVPMLILGCGSGDEAPKAEDTPLPAEATQGTDEGLPNPDVAQPEPENGAPPRPAAPPATTETTLDDPPPEEVPESMATPTPPDDSGAVTPGESVDEPPLPDPTVEPTEPT